MEHRIVTAAQMKQIEASGAAHGLSYRQMMENAGQAVWRELALRCPQPGRLLVVCGKGNNGGDGFVTARAAAQAGWQGSCWPKGNPVPRMRRPTGSCWRVCRGYSCARWTRCRSTPLQPLWMRCMAPVSTGHCGRRVPQPAPCWNAAAGTAPWSLLQTCPADAMQTPEPPSPGRCGPM